MREFTPEETRIFAYCRGEKNPDGSPKAVYVDPAAVERVLDMQLANRNHLIDQIQEAEKLKIQKSRDCAAYERDPAAYMAALAEKHGYQPVLPDETGAGQSLPNPESVEQYCARCGLRLPADFTPEEMAVISLGAIAHQNLCRGIRVVFDLPDLDPETGKGCTDAMAVAVLSSYHEWVEKKNGSTPG